MGQPLDTGKTCFQGEDVSRRKFSSPWHAIASLYRSDGIAGLYRGAPQRALVIVIIYFVLPFTREAAVQYKTLRLYSAPGSPLSPNFEWGRMAQRRRGATFPTCMRDLRNMHSAADTIEEVKD